MFACGCGDWCYEISVFSQLHQVLLLPDSSYNTVYNRSLPSLEDVPLRVQQMPSGASPKTPYCNVCAGSDNKVKLPDPDPDPGMRTGGKY